MSVEILKKRAVWHYIIRITMIYIIYVLFSIVVEPVAVIWCLQKLGVGIVLTWWSWFCVVIILSVLRRNPLRELRLDFKKAKEKLHDELKKIDELETWS